MPVAFSITWLLVRMYVPPSAAVLKATPEPLPPSGTFGWVLGRPFWPPLEAPSVTSMLTTLGTAAAAAATTGWSVLEGTTVTLVEDSAAEPSDCSTSLAPMNPPASPANAPTMRAARIAARMAGPRPDGRGCAPAIGGGE